MTVILDHSIEALEELYSIKYLIAKVPADPYHTELKPPQIRPVNKGFRGV